jgi:hypothetical protein
MAMPAKRALVVGINDYGSPQNNLPSCVKDANNFASFLGQTHGFSEIHKLLDGEATRPRVEGELSWLLRNAAKDDRLVFYYSGHGYTKLAGGTYEEYLVLRDGLWQDDQLSALTRDLPDGVLTVILDSCFSGGMLKLVMDPETGELVEVAKAKVWTPEGAEKGFEVDGLTAVGTIKRFGLSPVTGALNVIRSIHPDLSWRLAPFSSTLLGGAANAASRFGAVRIEAPRSKSADDEPNQAEMKGLLISASLPTETAAASTSKTKGMSAFTYALLEVLPRLGKGRSAEEVLNAAKAELKKLSFAQTPLVLEPASPGNLKHLEFITLAAQGAQVSADSQFWGALGSIFEPIFSSVTPSVLNAIRGRTKGFPTEVVGTAESSDPKFWGAIAPLIPTLVSTVAPMVANAVTRRRRKSAEDVTVEVTEDDIVADEKFWGAIATILPSVCSTVAPMIINAMAGRRKSDEYVGGGAASAEEDEFAPDVKFWGALSILPPIVSALTPHILAAMSGRRKGFVSAVEGGAVPEGEPAVIADEKFWGAFAALLPPLVETCAPIIIEAVMGAQQKAAEAPGEAEADPQEKFWRAIRDVIPAIADAVAVRVRPYVTGARKGFNAVPELTGNGSQAHADEKFWGAIAAFVPPLVDACAPVIIEAITGASRRKQLTGEVAPTKQFAPEQPPPAKPKGGVPQKPAWFADAVRQHVGRY